MKKITVATITVAALAISASPASSADVICGVYYGPRVCTPIRRTGPAKPTTHPTMVARATPKRVEVGSSVKLWMGPKKGKNGFVSGELVRFFDIYKGKTSEITGVRDTIKGGIARWGREYLSMPGVDPTGVHHLCALGERSGKLACAKVTVVWGKGSAIDDSYGGVAGGDSYKGVESTPTTPAPTTTPVPATSTTLASGFAPPAADGGFSTPSTD
ncbi:MAG: hypothetical protein ACO3C5_05850 [Ilumatobacteraceae bacterium]